MTIAFIPVRGGSKSIPLKNIKHFCGKPLVYWTVKALENCCNVDKVVVATDSLEIKNTVKNTTARIQKSLRSIIATDATPTETPFPPLKL